VGVTSVSSEAPVPGQPGQRAQPANLPRGLRLWYAVTAGIFWWAAHILTFASLARWRCLHPGTDWVLHGVTVVTALGTLLAMWWSLRILREGRDADDGSADPRGLRHFLGMLGLLIGLINLLLIVWEASYVFFIRACA
jgi:hypothetical protein